MVVSIISEEVEVGYSILISLGNCKVVSEEFYLADATKNKLASNWVTQTVIDAFSVYKHDSVVIQVTGNKYVNKFIEDTLNKLSELDISCKTNDGDIKLHFNQLCVKGIHKDSVTYELSCRRLSV